MRAYKNCASGRLLRLPTLNDVFVAENGQLQLGNIIFEECAQSQEGGEDGVDLSDFFFTLLTSVMSLSRTVRCQLLPSLSGANLSAPASSERPDQHGNNPTPTAGPSVDEEEAERAAEARRVDAAEMVVSVMEGSSLQLFFNGNCHGVKVLHLGESTAPPNRTDLQVHVLGEESVALVAAVADMAAGAGVTVHARGAGNLMLRVVAPVQEISAHSGGGVNFLALDVRIVVVPAYPIQSPALQEVAAQLHASYMSKNNDMFLSSHAIRLLDPETGESAPDAMLGHEEVAVHRDWTEIRLQLDQHLSRSSGGTGGVHSHSHKTKKSTHF